MSSSTSPTPDPEDPLEARERELMADLNESGGEALLGVRLFERAGLPVVRVEGELDVYTAAAFEARLAEVLDGDPAAVVIDLSATSFVDSRGLSVLLRAAHRLGGALAVVTPQERVLRLFRATGLAQSIALHRTLAAAVDALADD